MNLSQRRTSQGNHLRLAFISHFRNQARSFKRSYSHVRHGSSVNMMSQVSTRGIRVSSPTFRRRVRRTQRSTMRRRGLGSRENSSSRKRVGLKGANRCFRVTLSYRYSRRDRQRHRRRKSGNRTRYYQSTLRRGSRGFLRVNWVGNRTSYSFLLNHTRQLFSY